jgi:sterol desaturase/sphingolipid hydroxylase (fatty acid hydroxylase superfamily)
VGGLREFGVAMPDVAMLRFVLERLAHNSLMAAGALVVLSAGIGLLEFLSGGGLRHYRTQGFAQDVFYLFWHRSRFFHAFFLASFYVMLTPKTQMFDLQLLGRLPYIPRCIVAYLITDVFGYWLHRWQHTSRFLWAFHTTHHSQEHLSFASAYRFHPIEEFIFDVLPYLPLFALGVQPTTWVPLRILHDFFTYLQHSQIRWRFGPLRFVFTSPTFHAIHHSLAPEHHNKNFGPTMVWWDYMFGTAVKDEKYPERTGLADVKMPTVTSTLVTPFRLLHQFYFKHPDPSQEEEESASAAAAGD